MYLAPLVHQYEPSYLNPQRSNLLMILHGQPQPRLVSRGDSLVGSHPAKSADICLSKAAGPRGDLHPRSTQPPNNSHLQLARANFATSLFSHGGGVFYFSPARLAEGSRARMRCRSTVSARAPPPARGGPAPSSSRPRPLPRALWACKEVPARPLHSRARIRAPPEAGLTSRPPFCSSRGSSGERRRKPGAGRLGGGTRRGCCCHRRRHHRSWGSWRGEGGRVRPGREPAAAPLREGRRRDGDGGYRQTQHRQHHPTAARR